MVDKIDPTDVTGGGFKTSLGPGEIEDRIEDAHLEVVEKLAGEGLSGERLKAIEKYLTRHLIKFDHTGERQVNHKQIGSAQKRYSGGFEAESLRATSPGQTALELDTSGTLGEAGKSQANFEVF